MNSIRLKETLLDFKKNAIRAKNRYITNIKIVKVIEIAVRRYLRVESIN